MEHHTNGYTQRVLDTILPLSIAGTLPAAFHEWEFTGFTLDHGEGCETCQLCGHEQLRFHFEIANCETCNTLMVGSHCITKFNLAVPDERGQRLEAAAAKSKLNKIRQKLEQQSCLNALQQLCEAAPNPYVRSALDYYTIHRRLSPRLAAIVFARMPIAKIPCTFRFFSIELKRKKHLKDLADMEEYRVHLIRGALTHPQRRKAIKLGHTPPPGWAIMGSLN